MVHCSVLLEGKNTARMKTEPFQVGDEMYFIDIINKGYIYEKQTWSIALTGPDR